jgi:Tetratricopeptide repeat
LFRQRQDLAGEARALTNLGNAEGRLGQNRSVVDHLNLALTLHRQTGNVDGQAHVLTVLGDTLRTLGEHREAADHHQQALAL